MGYATASHLAAYSSLVEVVSTALGGKGDGADKVINEDLREVDTGVFQTRVAQLLSA